VRPSRGSLKSIHSNALARQASSLHWQNIVKCLDHTPETMKNNYVSLFLIFFSCLTIRELHKCIAEYNFNFVGASGDNKENIEPSICIFECATLQQVLLYIIPSLSTS